MSKFSLIGLSLLMAFAGCGRGWLPCLHRGAPCMSGACAQVAPAPAMLASTGCSECGNSNIVGYPEQGSYIEGTPEVIGQSERVLPSNPTIVPSSPSLTSPR